MDALRTWQAACLKDILRQFATRRDYLVTATPGGGKTTLALAGIIRLVALVRRLVRRARRLARPFRGALPGRFLLLCTHEVLPMLSLKHLTGRKTSVGEQALP